MPQLDNSFGFLGFVTHPFALLPGHNWYVGIGVVLQPDGKVVVGGNAGGLLVPSDFAVARYYQDGNLDSTFGGIGSVPGVVITDFGGNDVATGVAIQKDRKILLAGWTDVHGGYEFALARYNVDGSPDTSFGTNGQQTTHFGPKLSIAVANAIALEADGSIIAGGSYSLPSASPKPAFAIARYNGKGQLVDSWVDYFGGQNAIINGLAVRKDGEIVAAGEARLGLVSCFALAQYRPNGQPDPAFGTGGRVVTAFTGPWGAPSNARARAVAIQPDGRIVAAGVAYFGSNPAIALARYDTNGNLDPSFGSSGLVVDDRLMEIRALAIDQKGRIVVAGHAVYSGSASPFYHFAVLRFEPNGSADALFLPPTGFITPVPSSLYDEIHGVAIETDGKTIKIIGAGVSEQPGGDVVFALVRYL